jgi:hypothetical protein
VKKVYLVYTSLGGYDSSLQKAFWNEFDAKQYVMIESKKNYHEDYDIVEVIPE